MSRLTPSQFELIAPVILDPQSLIADLSAAYGWNEFALRGICSDLAETQEVEINVPCQKTIIREAIKRSRVFLTIDDAIEAGEMTIQKLAAMNRAADQLESIYGERFTRPE